MMGTRLEARRWPLLRLNRAVVVKELIMEAGERRTFEKGDGNAVVSAVGLWAARDGIHLRIDTTDDGVRDHRILFRDLREVLMADGCWECEDEDAEGQATRSAED